MVIIFIIIAFIYNYNESKDMKLSVLKTKNIIISTIKKNNRYRKRRIIIVESKGEKECRDLFETLFIKKFKKKRFYLNRDDIKFIELDGYNDNIKTKIGIGLAFEYDGQQHYKFTKYFHKNKKDFENQIFRDQIKNDYCRSNNICLIRIPYNVKNKKMFILNELKKYI